MCKPILLRPHSWVAGTVFIFYLIIKPLQPKVDFSSFWVWQYYLSLLYIIFKFDFEIICFAKLFRDIYNFCIALNITVHNLYKSGLMAGSRIVLPYTR